MCAYVCVSVCHCVFVCEYENVLYVQWKKEQKVTEGAYLAWSVAWLRVDGRICDCACAYVKTYNTCFWLCPCFHIFVDLSMFTHFCGCVHIYTFLCHLPVFRSWRVIFPLPVAHLWPATRLSCVSAAAESLRWSSASKPRTSKSSSIPNSLCPTSSEEIP